MISPIQKILNIKFRNKLILMCIIAIVPVTVVGLFLLYNKTIFPIRTSIIIFICRNR